MIELEADYDTALVTHDVHHTSGRNGCAHIAAVGQHPLPKKHTQEYTHLQTDKSSGQ